MVPEKKKRKRKVGICVRSWCAMFLERGCPQTEKDSPSCASHFSLCVHLCVCFLSPAEPRDSTKYFVRVDAGAGRCPRAGTMQNMQEWG